MCLSNSIAFGNTDKNICPHESFREPAHTLFPIGALGQCSLAGIDISALLMKNPLAIYQEHIPHPEKDEQLRNSRPCCSSSGDDNTYFLG